MTASPGLITFLWTAWWLVSALAPSLVASDTGDWTPLLVSGKLELWTGRPHLDPRSEAAWSAEERAAKQAAWDLDMQQHWSVVPAEGNAAAEIVSDGQGVFLTTRKDYRDFEFVVEWKMCQDHADSGIYLRGSPQVQIWDPQDPNAEQHGADRGSGALWNNAADSDGKWPLALADRPIGEWNKLRIVMVGARVWVWLNDVATVTGAVLENYWDRELPMFATGCIQLQTHGGEMRFRQPAIREIYAEEANRWLREISGEGWEPLCNGLDLGGWSGPLAGCHVKDGILVSTSGTVYTEREFGDFDLYLEFRLPAGGNNGLAIRYPGAGDAAYEGMCELQVLDNHHPQYQDLDPRQLHGSVYGLVAAQRGYLRPAGSWNSQLVRVRGTTVAVELNGTPILAADLAAVTDFLDDRPHPGRERTSGHLGLCGHGSPVEFGRLSIRPPRDR